MALGWDDAALEASKKHRPDDFKKYARLISNQKVLNTRTHNKAERADSATKQQPAIGWGLRGRLMKQRHGGSMLDPPVSPTTAVAARSRDSSAINTKNKEDQQKNTQKGAAR